MVEREKSREELAILERLRALCAALPEAQESVDGHGHTSFRVANGPDVSRERARERERERWREREWGWNGNRDVDGNGNGGGSGSESRARLTGRRGGAYGTISPPVTGSTSPVT